MSLRGDMALRHGMYVSPLQFLHLTLAGERAFHRDSKHGTSAHQNQEYWSLLDGDEYGTWVDARLTELGESQAEIARSVWKKQMEMHIPAPQSYYVSPLNRCCRTAQITFEGVGLPGTSPFRPVVKEVGC